MYDTVLELLAVNCVRYLTLTRPYFFIAIGKWNLHLAKLCQRNNSCSFKNNFTQLWLTSISHEKKISENRFSRL